MVMPVNAPCILFIDEIDCIGKRRRGDGAAMENNQTINALLQRMDGLNNTPGVCSFLTPDSRIFIDASSISLNFITPSLPCIRLIYTASLSVSSMSAAVKPQRKDTDTTGDTKLRLKSEMEEDIMVLLAGKCGEDIVYGEHTQGCGNDIAVATEKVYEMIVCYGNSNQSLMNQAIMVEKGYLNHVQSSVLDTRGICIFYCNTTSTTTVCYNTCLKYWSF